MTDTGDTMNDPSRLSKWRCPGIFRDIEFLPCPDCGEEVEFFPQDLVMACSGLRRGGQAGLIRLHLPLPGEGIVLLPPDGAQPGADGDESILA